MQLYKHNEEYRKTMAALEDMDLTPEEFADNMAAVEADIRDKVIAVAVQIKNMKALAVALGGEKSELDKRIKSLNGKIEWLENYIMVNSPFDKVEDARVTISKKQGAQRVELDVKPEDLPEQYRNTKTTTTADKRAIKEAIDSEDKEIMKLAHIERGADTVVIK